MYKIVIVSHGTLAEAFFETLKLFSPEISGVYTVELDNKGINIFEKRIDILIEKIKNDNVLVFTDLFYGTPFNVLSKKINSFKGDKEIVAGVNLPALMEAMLQRNQMTISEIIPLIKQANKAILLTEKLTNEVNDDDE
ncbi:PTS sugar transporter subunit IIA [Dellaglioa algida]|uniref:PTS sugar transporter subunit IIA n=1 Tax=Dellaglioa algida TaxID=105612 RepID=UPI000BCBE93A|nr:PTS sugar transporter subunit IIA [Dellaglioa algida]MDK1717762.1 hypothetical protein [Dellaglioa algida]MDK1729334.1 hypothetical protein [Dellaglioa algida]MDK1741791.1 hypothetical protein [Dellaglioa algida]SOB50878.1 conserved hypothetical protein [Dellaglioa algida]